MMWMFTRLAYQADADEYRAVFFPGQTFDDECQAQLCWWKRLLPAQQTSKDTVNGILKSLYLGMGKKNVSIGSKK